MINFNWIDLIAGFFFIRIGYSGLKRGFFTEVFKLCATLISIILGLYFWKTLGETRFFLPGWLLRQFFVCGIFIIVFFAFWFLRKLLNIIVKIKILSPVNIIASGLIAIVRAFLFTSMIFVLLSSLPFTYVQKSLWECSLSGAKIIKIVPNVYNYLIKFVPENLATEFEIDMNEYTINQLSSTEQES
ncbi:MAG: hypothetical protein DRP78_07280 [Candidatus Omnitrophota bacterium]|nr:MAG: hypothetical protein DRP78_07280 [Candidatus Omnitrophota bacterium]